MDCQRIVKEFNDPESEDSRLLHVSAGGQVFVADSAELNDSGELVLTVGLRVVTVSPRHISSYEIRNCSV